MKASAKKDFFKPLPLVTARHWAISHLTSRDRRERFKEIPFANWKIFAVRSIGTRQVVIAL
jgi:hypothetical protein